MEKTSHLATMERAAQLTFAFAIQGALDEDTALPELPASPVLKSISIDWSGTRYVCASGIAHWLKWVRATELAHPGVSFEFHGCPSSVIRVINTVEEILPQRARVLSFQVPFLLNRQPMQHLVRNDRDRKLPISPKEILREIHVRIHGEADIPFIDKVELDIAPNYLDFLRTSD